ncbi:hypothetical protein B0H10DRAFT_2201550 [Mycena sp. CBHHK59/15]|nr:hypothetical protein B0H10DRAFT_2201550 [Mycena sp. CBHHK59/15]
MPRTAAKHICFECGTAIGAAHSRRYHASAYRYRLDGQWFRIDRVHGRLRCPHGSCEKTYKDTRSLSRHLEDGKLHEDRYYGVVDFEPLLPSEVRAIDLRARAPSSAVPPPPFSSQQPAPYPSSSMSIPSPLRPPQRGSDPFWDEPVPTLSMLERLTKRNDSPAVQTVAPLSPSGSSASSRERTLSPNADVPVNRLSASYTKIETEAIETKAMGRQGREQDEDETEAKTKRRRRRRRRQKLNTGDLSRKAKSDLLSRKPEYLYKKGNQDKWSVLNRKRDRDLVQEKEAVITE